jgi:hypothetical protein
MNSELENRHIYSSLVPVFPNVSSEEWAQIAPSCENAENMKNSKHDSFDGSKTSSGEDRIFILQRNK